YRATDPEALQGNMREIDRLERSEVHVAEIRDFREHYPFFLLPALLLFLLELNLRAIWLRSLP
ncbi:MAG: aerotolerance regulator BatA, partial [Gemmatimonadales bacterium]